MGVRKTIRFSPDLLDAINNYCNTNGGISFSEGVRELIFKGLDK